MGTIWSPFSFIFTRFRWNWCLLTYYGAESYPIVRGNNYEVSFCISPGFSFFTNVWCYTWILSLSWRYGWQWHDWLNHGAGQWASKCSGKLERRWGWGIYRDFISNNWSILLQLQHNEYDYKLREGGWGVLNPCNFT